MPRNRSRIYIDGIDDFLRDFNNEVQRIQGRTEKGLVKAALFLRGEAQKKAPVDTGNLRASAFVITPSGRTRGNTNIKWKTRGEDTSLTAELERGHAAAIEYWGSQARSESFYGPVAIVGFSAYYAVYVHEIDANYTVGEWKFLENAMRENRRRIIKIIKENRR